MVLSYFTDVWTHSTCLHYLYIHTVVWHTVTIKANEHKQRFPMWAFSNPDPELNLAYQHVMLRVHVLQRFGTAAACNNFNTQLRPAAHLDPDLHETF